MYTCIEWEREYHFPYIRRVKVVLETKHDFTMEFLHESPNDFRVSSSSVFDNPWTIKILESGGPYKGKTIGIPS